MRETIHSMDTPSPASDDLEPLPLKEWKVKNTGDVNELEPPEIQLVSSMTAPIEFHDSELENHYAALDDDSMQLLRECMGISL